MTHELLIESGPHETRVALLEDGRVVEVHIERLSEPGVVGSIYKGRVSRVVPGIQAAFVDIGLERDAFLFAGDLPRSKPLDPSEEDGQSQPPPEPRPIADQVQQGQELLVQVVKEPLPGKGARISLQLSIPGRFAVLLPGASGVGISRRISEPAERQRLEEAIRELLPEGQGVIVRTAGEGRTQEELRRELEWLSKTWEEVRERSTGVQVPGPVRREMSLAQRAVRDLLNEAVTDIWIEDASGHAALERYLATLDPEAVDRLRLYGEETPLFERRGVEATIAKAMQARTWLKSGGFIVINPTEALVAIDVNSGRNTEAAELEATALQTNLEAAVEVARQIRLRDLAGIIVVDFIDMIDSENRAELVATFERALSHDRTRIQVSEMSDFGLIAVTRKRMRGGLRQRLTQVCPCCSGEGRIKDPTTIGLELDRALRRQVEDLPGEHWRVKLHPSTMSALESTAGDILAAMAKRVDGRLDLEVDSDMGREEFQISTL